MTNSYTRTSKFTCQWCDKSFFESFRTRHEKACWSHPERIKYCPVCNKPTKMGSETCSKSCSNTYNRSGSSNPNWKNGGSNYRNICFETHGKSCLICGESNIVEAHHIDHNRSNNDPMNLIPLCPTHHNYWHYGFKHLIEKQIKEYLKTFRT